MAVYNELQQASILTGDRLVMTAKALAKISPKADTPIDWWIYHTKWADNRPYSYPPFG